MWQSVPAVPALEKLKQQDPKFKVNLGYVANERQAWAT